MTRFIGGLWLRMTGWCVEGSLPPDSPRLVFIAAPHTSNWDLPYMLAIAWTLGIRMSWMGKKSLFGAPFGAVMRWLGGIPVDRSAPHGLVTQMANEFARRDSLALAIPPEGSRAFRPHWKSGFYQIALAAQVPIACGFLDYERKCGGIGPVFVPTGDEAADMARLAEFYTPIRGKFPDRFGPVRFQEPSAKDETHA